jgi:hypothetical protein
VGGGAAPAPVLSRNLSANGKRAFFETPDALVPADTNGEGGCAIVGGQAQNYPACRDVYEWEATGTGSCMSEVQAGGCLYLISSGKDDEPSLFGDANLEGDDVFFFTAERLVGQDKDDLYDAYDARIGGGLASQNQIEAPPCGGEGCKGSPTPALTTQVPGSASFTGPGDPPPKRPGLKKHHKKSVKANQYKKHKAKKKHKTKKRKAKTNRGASR